MFIEESREDLSAWKSETSRNILFRLINESQGFLKNTAETYLRDIYLHGENCLQEVHASCVALLKSEASTGHEPNLAKLAYVTAREKGVTWNEILPYFRKTVSSSKEYFSKEFDIYDNRFASIPSLIRQMRHNPEHYTREYIENVGFFNKNRSALYTCYNKPMARDYISLNFGDDITSIFDRLEIPQAESDFFLLLSLYKEGGVSVDIHSVARANISPIVNCARGLGIIEREGFLDKSFFCSRPDNSLIKAYIERVVAYVEHCIRHAIPLDYNLITSKYAFQAFILDSFSTEPDAISKDSITLIDAEVYDSFIESTPEEEDIPYRDNGIHFKRVNIVGFASRNTIKSDISTCKLINSMPGCYFPPSDNVTIVGNTSKPEAYRQTRNPAAIPQLNIFQVNDLGLSGHGSYWSKGKFLRLEAYLSFVTEQETLAGHWKSLDQAENVRHVEEPVIVAFGAGYGCYGHYLVDDIPRLKVAQKLLGEEEFRKRKIVITSETPSWGRKLLNTVAGIPSESFLFFDHVKEFLTFSDAIIPSYVNMSYMYHKFIKECYEGLVSEEIRPWRKICLSRKAWEPNKTFQRVFEQQDTFEEMARERGYEIVQPETLSIEEQIRLVAETRCQIGEHGSAQHASVYNQHGMTIGTLNPLNQIQANIGRIYRDRNVLVFPDKEQKDDRNNTFFSFTPKKLEEFFRVVEAENQARDHLYEA
ncbi:hypothetical protein A0U92_01915 [Acetobacter aceti]|uniref:Glycosyltransferase 61 catalytic domain-containing protein n=2 Tax=Acetobacter aceti TaxID=435 RepID=A0A1U9KD58_ACEAC|nr:hypothetical protein A0U92_01915 [Acetobacter aceti]